MTEGDADELVEFWTLLDRDRALRAGKRGATALGYALLMKYYSRHGRFPRSGACCACGSCKPRPLTW